MMPLRGGPKIKIPPPRPSGPPIEPSTTFKYDGQEYMLNASTLENLSVLGRGAHGFVQKMRHVPSGSLMAVKTIPFTSDAAVQRNLLRELKNHMAVADCPFIVQFFGAFYVEGQVWISMEVMDVSLEHFYKKVHKIRGELQEDIFRSKFQEDFLNVVAYSVLKALNYLKTELKVVHRDIKPSNILLNRNGSVKMCDFGISGNLVNSITNTLVGTQNYMAPEKVRPNPEKKGFGVTSDVWSFGITMLEVATGKFPYNEWKSLFEQIKEVVEEPPPQLPSGVFSQQFEDFTSLCLQKNADDRPRYPALLEHPFVKHLSTTSVDISTFVCDVLDTPSPTDGALPST